MWPLIEADLRYHATAIGVGYAFALFAFFAKLATGGDVIDLAGTTSFIYLIVVAVILHRQAKEGRDREWALLPVTLRERAAARVVLLFIVQSGMLMLSIALFLIKGLPSQPNLIWGVLADHASTLAFVVALLIYIDLGHQGQPGLRPLFAVGTVLFLCGWLLLLVGRQRGSDIEIDYPNMFESATQTDALLWYATLAGLVAMSLWLYRRRVGFLG